MPVVDLGPRLIDTSVWIRSDRKGHEALRDRLKELLVAGFVLICWPIRAELLIGVKTSERWASLDEQLAALEQVSIMEVTWSRAARLGHELARKGQRVPLPDLRASRPRRFNMASHCGPWMVISNESQPSRRCISICLEPISFRAALKMDDHDLASIGQPRFRVDSTLSSCYSHRRLTARDCSRHHDFEARKVSVWTEQKIHHFHAEHFIHGPIRTHSAAISRSAPLRNSQCWMRHSKSRGRRESPSAAP